MRGTLYTARYWVKYKLSWQISRTPSIQRSTGLFNCDKTSSTDRVIIVIIQISRGVFWKEIAGSFTKYLHLKVLLLGRTYFFLTIFGGQSPWQVDAISLGARFLRGLENFKTLTLWSSCYALPLFSYNKGFVGRKWTFEVKLCCDIANKKVKCINGRLFCDLSLWASHQYVACHIFDSQHYLVKVGWLVINQRVKADKGSC